MEQICASEHLECRDYDRSEKPLIEIVRIAKGTRGESTIANNEIVFVIEGRVRYRSLEQRVCEAFKGHIIFRPAAVAHSYEAMTDFTAVIFRVRKPMQLCRNYSIEKLYNTHTAYHKQPDSQLVDGRSAGKLEINSRIWHLLDGVMDCIGDGLRCHNWAESKITEFFTYLRIYYSKGQVHQFLMPIISGDTAFTEYARLNRHRFKTVDEMANSLNMSPKQFARKFKNVFGQTPYKWMILGRAQRVLPEITSTKKPFKQIAYENEFNSEQQFTRFIRLALGNSPTELRKESIAGEIVKPKSEIGK